MKIAVSAASGQLGQLVLEALLQRTAPANIVAIARTPSRLADFAARGVEVRAGDYSDKASMVAALEGVEHFLLISSSEIGQRIEQHGNAIAAAKAAGVQQLAYTSLLHADTSPLSLAAEHLATEALIKDSGIPYTLLRNGWYTENLTASVGAALAHDAVVGASGNGRYSSASRKDYAEAAAVVLTQSGHDNQVYELAGDSAYTKAQLASVISELAGKPIHYQPLSVAELSDVLQGAGLPAYLADAIAGWDADAASQCLEDNSHTLSRLLGRATTPLRDSVNAALAQLG